MNLTEVSSTQRFKEVTINENFESIDYSSVYGKRLPVTSGLTWGYWGGRWGGFSVAAGTLTLTNAADNYIVVLRSTGAISVSTASTNWDNTQLYARVYKITVAGSVVTAVEDHRAGPGGVHGPSATTVSGPSSSTDNAISRFDGTTGKLLQNSVVTISDTGAIAGAISLSISQGTITDPANAFTVASTWNDAADTFVGASIDITDTASAAASVLLRGRIGGADRFSFSKAGALTLAAGISATTATFSGIAGFAAGAVGAPSLYITGSATTGLYQTAADELAVAIAGVNTVTFVGSQRTIFGSVASYPISTTTLTPRVQVHGTNQSNATLGIYNWANDDNPPVLALGKSKSGTIGTHSTAVADGTDLAQIRIQASDGDEFRIAALLFWESVATIANNQTPCRATMQTANASGTVTTRMIWDQLGSVVCGSAAIATSATDGFLYIPSCPGTPTGVPTSYTGRLPLVVDSSNNKLYFYSGAWRDAGP